ncbi:MAG: hypothetical protein RBU45_10955 [Myxococcota bacterium]|jgi:hypothetical protein|nr:hypothetical protein [Myxococcota bacterium]
MLHRHPLERLLLGASLLPLLLVTGCGPPRTELVPGPRPADVALGGRWTSNWGELKLAQEGEAVRGTFDYNDGQLEGVLQGDLFLFDWLQPPDPTAARMTVKGKGYFRISPDGQILEGAWGYGAQREGGGAWRAQRINR